MNWLVKNRRTASSLFDGEVIINEVTKNTIPSVAFRFRKDSQKKFLGDNLYLAFAIENNRMYFKETANKYGWKLSESGCNKFFKLYKKNVPLADEWYGEYNLEWDNKLNLYFIDLNHKLTDNLNWLRKRGQ